MRKSKGLQNMIATAFVPIIIYYFVHQISAMVLFSLISKVYPGQTGANGSSITMLAKMLAMILGGVSVIFYYVKEKNDKEGDNGKKEIETRFNFADACGIVVAGAAFSLGLNFLFAITGLVESSTNYSQVASEQFSYALLPALLFYGVVSPMVEEMVFRGIVYTSLKRNLNTKIAIVGSALLFGTIHGNIVQMLYGTIMGCIMAILYEKYGKLLAPILFHGAANATVYLCTYLF